MGKRLSILLILNSIRLISASEFDWDSIEPSKSLQFFPCHDEFQCARLEVPLDWLDENKPHTVVIAIIKLPAIVPDSDPSFGGTIITNPGGPGGSGIEQVRVGGHRYQSIVDGYRHYEIMSFDPRGVGHTTPKLDCYGDIFSRIAASIQGQSMGTVDISLDALRRQHARLLGYGSRCADTAVDGSVLPYITTASVARDMVEIIDKIEELRAKNGKNAATSPDASQKPMTGSSSTEKVARIQYWGTSYGSVLGNTFASMYPGRVGRLILDGICDADDYMKGVSKTEISYLNYDSDCCGL
jgi:pimeloyl-ACP methyl ester carboxylesterase